MLCCLMLLTSFSKLELKDSVYALPAVNKQRVKLISNYDGKSASVELAVNFDQSSKSEIGDSFIN